MSPRETFDASSPEEVEAAERNSRATQKSLDRSLAKILADPDGRRVLWWIVRDLSGWFDRTYTGDAGTYFNEGRRQVGTALVERMMKENKRALGDLINEMAS